MATKLNAISALGCARVVSTDNRCRFSSMRLLLIIAAVQHAQSLTIQRRQLAGVTAAAAVAAMNTPAHADDAKARLLLEELRVTAADAARVDRPAKVSQPPPASDEAASARLSGASTRITNSEGFAFDAPEGYEAKPKPVKTHAAEVLYKNGKREIGVVVDWVRITALSEFGTPQFVGDKVVAGERERDGVTAAELSKASEFLVDGQAYYELAYSNESSRGNNNFLSRVAVRGGRLYVMTLKARVDDAGALAELRGVAGGFRVSGV